MKVAFYKGFTYSQVEGGGARVLNAVASNCADKADLSKFPLKKDKLWPFQKLHWHDLSGPCLQSWSNDKEHCHTSLPMCFSLLQLEISM